MPQGVSRVYEPQSTDSSMSQEERQGQSGDEGLPGSVHHYIVILKHSRQSTSVCPVVCSVCIIKNISDF